MEKGFTLVIPIYNKINTLQRTLDSVMNNHGTYPFRCLLIDDDSDDGSSEIAAQYDREHPGIFTYYKIVHHGIGSPSNARNIGIRLCDTELIGFLDAGDDIRPGFIDRGCTFMEEHPEYSLYGNACYHHYLNEDGTDWYKPIHYTRDDVHDFHDYIDAFGGDVHFSANIYRTDLARQIMFRVEYGEDVVFKFSYIYKFPHIYIDNSTCESVVWNYDSNDSGPWCIQRTNKHWLVEIMDNVKQVVPDFGKEYEFYWDDETQEVRYQRWYLNE